MRARKSIWLIATCALCLLLAGCGGVASHGAAPASSEAASATSQTTSIPAPNYADAKSWVRKPSEPAHGADTFFVLPTVNMKETVAGNEDIYDERRASRFTKTLGIEGGIVSEATDVYCPFYRQATVACYLGKDGKTSEEAAKAEGVAGYLEVAYEDVRNAWLHYAEHCNNGRPVVLFGYSQGAEMVMRLLEEFGGEGVLAQRLVAAYAIGTSVDEVTLAKYPHLRMAQSATDTGVIVSYNAMDARATLPATRELSINPLNWRTDSTPASKDENLGMVVTNSDGKVTEEVAAYCGTRLDEKSGKLIVTDVPNADELYQAEGLFPAGNYHMYDLSFFYRNLQQNVADRVRSFQGTSS